MLEEEDAIVFGRQVFQLVPVTGFEALQALIMPELLTQVFLGDILDFVLELELVFTPHLHLYAFGTFFCLFALWLVFPIGLRFILF